MAIATYKPKARKMKKVIGQVPRRKGTLVFADNKGIVYEIDRNTKGRPKGAKNKKGKR